jgi:hypothetical protein
LAFNFFDIDNLSGPQKNFKKETYGVFNLRKVITGQYWNLPLETPAGPYQEVPLQRCSVAKMFFTSMFSYFTFLQPHPSSKLKLGQQISGKLVIANHLDQ